MAHPMGEREAGVLRLGFDRRLKLDFHGSKVTSDAGLLPYRELDDAVGLSEIAGDVLTDTRRGKNGRHGLVGQFRQSVFGRLGGYDDVNDADRLSLDPVMRWIVGGHAVTKQAASTSQMGRFETEVLATNANVEALANLSGQWIDKVHDRHPPTKIILDMDSSVSPTHGDQEGTAYNGHFGCTCYHPLFLFNQFGDLERSSLRPGNVHSADDWEGVLKPVVVRYSVGRYDCISGAMPPSPRRRFTITSKRGLPVRDPPQSQQGSPGKHRPSAHATCWPTAEPCAALLRQFQLSAGSWDRKRRVVAKVEWHLRRAGSPCRLHRHQPVAASRAGGGTSTISGAKPVEQYILTRTSRPTVRGISHVFWSKRTGPAVMPDVPRELSGTTGSSFTPWPRRCDNLAVSKVTSWRHRSFALPCPIWF